MSEPRQSAWHRLLTNRISRRNALKQGAAGGIGLLPLQLQAAEIAPAEPRLAEAAAVPAANDRLDWEPIQPSTEDRLILPKGHADYNVVCAYGDSLGGDLTFGFNNDHIAYLPIDLLEGKRSSDDGLLVVNHEYPHLVLQHGLKKEAFKEPRDPAQVKLERSSLGVSVLRVKRQDDKWSVVKNDPHNRRVDGYAECELTGPVRGAGVVGGAMVVRGTVGNCSGGVTPWGTVLSCEENVDEYADKYSDKGYGWGSDYDKSHFGWVVEVDPFDPKSTPKKRTAMGRFRHENVAVSIRPDGRVAAYMGDDKRDACIYKFVSDKAIDPSDRKRNMDLLEEGRLFAADFAKGRWVELDYKSPLLRSAEIKDAKDNRRPRFPSRADVLFDARAAALTLGATPVDRPEDIEIHPLEGHIYVALTNNDLHGNFHGQIVRVREDPQDETAFQWDFFATGGPQSGFSSPDNLLFDPDGNLWMVTDISSPKLPPAASSAEAEARKAANRIYSFQGNNAMFVFRTSGRGAGIARQFASGPVECEMTGPCWTPDGTTLFLSIQHPGEETADPAHPTSQWPHDGKGPRPAVVAIKGFKPFNKPHRPFYGGDWISAGEGVAGASGD